MHANINFLYILILAIFTGYEVINRVPTILHTPLMSGTNFIHGIILIGTMAALAQATTATEQTIGFFAVLIATINAVGGYIVTKRMLGMFVNNE
jgi:H+-translocating NAD(P) transhydrogenase subunit alpha